MKNIKLKQMKVERSKCGWLWGLCQLCYIKYCDYVINCDIVDRVYPKRDNYDAIPPNVDYDDRINEYDNIDAYICYDCFEKHKIDDKLIFIYNKRKYHYLHYCAMNK